jgi:hypothetical protein
MIWKWIFIAAWYFLPLHTVAADTSPYAGQENREIKALSKDEVAGYLAGDGLGFAKAAELNHYPGPKHVLELASQIRLSDEQRRRTQEIFAAMKSKAVSLGKQLIEKEHLLDSRFAEGTISNTELDDRLTEISLIQGKIRAAHLQAHLAQRAVLTADQIRHYDTLRGYQHPEAHGQHGGH